MKTKLKQGRGITLIALVITIIVLLILAGISISMLTGDNGILTQANKAKTTTDKVGVEEQIKLAVIAARTNVDGTIDLSVLEEELGRLGTIGTDIIIEKQGTDGKLPWKVTTKAGMYQITETGQVIAVEGVSLDVTSLKLLAGETRKLTATKTEGTEGIVVWSSTDETVATVAQDGTVTVKTGATAGETTTIKAEVQGTEYKAECTVTVAVQATGLSIAKITVGRTKTEAIGEITVNPTNAEEITEITYTSNDTSIATVDEDGIVTGVAVGTTTITVAAKGKSSNASVTGTCNVEVTPKTVSVTAQQIAANPKAYYGTKVENYKASESDTNIYRIFYVDAANDFGDGNNTIYLKADYGIYYNLDNYATYDATNTLVEAMNPDWASERRTSTWNINEQAAAYLCSPIDSINYDDDDVVYPWKSYYMNNSKVNYVIGGPSVEMYVKSYNQAYKDELNSTIYPLGANYRADGYVYTLNGAKSTISNFDDFTGNDSLDFTKYDSMYCGEDGSKAGDWWLASPSAYNSSDVCLVDGSNANLNSNFYSLDYGLSPLVSLKSNFTIEVLE